MQLTFLGATQTVTGSKSLLEVDNKKILIDCGLFQGHKELRLRNWEKLSVDPKAIDAVLLTHAHIDHSGYIPLLIKQGFSGKIYCTSATKDLCSILFPDCGHLQEEEARLANKYGYSKHKPALPLYTREDGLAALKYLNVIDFNQSFNLAQNIQVQYKCAGHILGAAFIIVTCQGKTILFSGDLGRLHNPIAFEPESVDQTDYLVLESTYGDRLHEATNPLDQFAEIINKTYQRGGSIVIPAFAVGRSQLVLYYLYQLKQQKRIPDIPIYMDSPMAIDATGIFYHHADDHRLTPELTQKVCSTAIYVNESEESKVLDTNRASQIIISASGMATGGRVLHHLKVFLKDKNSTILFVGYQASGTRGWRLAHGEKEIKIHGEMIPVVAEVVCLDNLSAHADYQEILTWLKHFKKAPKKIFLVHGEKEASESLQTKIKKELNWTTIIPVYLQKEVLS